MGRELLVRIIIGVLSAGVVAFVTIGVPSCYDYLTIKRSQVAVGEWMSEWRWDHEPEGEWHWETVQLETELRKIRIWSTYSSLGDEWEGEGRLVKNVHGIHIVGGWWSTKPGAVASGPFVLTTLGAHGESMYGYFGDLDVNEPVVATWVMGRDSSHIAQAKRWITEHRTPQPSLEGTSE
jgi:hypothetical protein